MGTMETIGILSLLPPIVAIALAIITKQVIISLFVGVWLGATLLASNNPILGMREAFTEYVFPSMGDPYNASVIFMVFFCGAFSILLEKSGGAQAFADVIVPKVKSRRGGQLVTALGGTAYFISDSSNPVLIGPLFKPVTDRLHISREKLAYLVDATTATMPSMFFFTAWGAYITSIIAEQFNEIGNDSNVTIAFTSSVPFMFYTIVAVAMVWVISGTGWDFGPMKRAEERAAKTGKVIADEDRTETLVRKIVLPEGAKPTIWNMILPIVTLLVVIFACLLWTGGFPGNSIAESLANASSMISIDLGFLAGSLVAAFLCVHTKCLTLKEVVETFFEGMRMMTDIVLILTLAWGIGSVCSAVGTTGFVINSTVNFMTPALLFFGIFIAAASTAWATGTSWGTFAIYLPLAIPMAAAIDAPMAIAIGTVISGGIFGDHCSPISDTTVLSCMGSSCDIVAHVKTQTPYALIVAASTAVSYLVCGSIVNSYGTSATAVIGIAITLGMSVLLLFIFSKIFNKGYDDRLTAEAGS